MCRPTQVARIDILLRRMNRRRYHESLQPHQTCVRRRLSRRANSFQLRPEMGAVLSKKAYGVLVSAEVINPKIKLGAVAFHPINYPPAEPPIPPFFSPQVVSQKRQILARNSPPIDNGFGSPDPRIDPMFRQPPKAPLR